MASSDFKKDLPPSDDQRYLPRWNVNNRIICKLPKADVHECITRDLSCTGASLFTSAKIASKQKVSLTVHLTNLISFEVQGRVLWNKSADNGHLVGVVFEDVSQEIQELILQHAFEVRREDLRKHWFSGWDKK